MGYDYLKGNPGSDTIDEGFRVPILKLDFAGPVTGDGKWSVPTQVHICEEPTAQFESTATLITSEQEYRKDISEDVSYEGAFSASYEGFGAKANVGVSFALSDSFQSTSEQLSSSETNFF